MSRKKGFTPYSFEKIGKNKVSVCIYAEMINSPAWGKLSKNAMVLYMYMKLQLYGQKTIEGKTPVSFFFNKALYKKYQLYTNDRQFRKDRDLLIKYGFIECEENGRTTRTKNIYRFSDKWKGII